MISIHYLILAWIVMGTQAFSLHPNNHIQAQDSVGPFFSSPKRLDIVALEPLPPTYDSATSTSATPVVHRRDAFQNIAVVIGASLLFAGVRPATAATTDDDSNRIFLKGVVSLPADYNGRPTPDAATTMTTTPALYVTCRPDRPDNVPGAILSGTRGKPPPVLAARFENPTFPFQFELGSKDLTMEGISNDSGTAAMEDPNLQNVWWNKENLVVSARLDSDGVAATRSPEDLVGRGFWKNGDASVEVPLSGRGAFGKFATGAKK
jgi:hypothetical protein